MPAAASASPWPARIVASVASRWTWPRTWLLARGRDGPFGVGPGCGQVSQAPQRVGMLYLDQARLDVSGLGRFLTEADASRHLLRPAHARMAAVPVSHPRARLGLQRAQVSDQRRGQVLPGALQSRLGILNDLPVQPPGTEPGGPAGRRHIRRSRGRRRPWPSAGRGRNTAALPPAGQRHRRRSRRAWITSGSTLPTTQLGPVPRPLTWRFTGSGVIGHRPGAAVATRAGPPPHGAWPRLRVIA